MSWPSSLLALYLFSPDDFSKMNIGDSSQLLEAKGPSRSGFGGGWLQLWSLKSSQTAETRSKVERAGEPQTIQDVTGIVAANIPVFFFHDQERYFPCTVEWFLERAKLVNVARGWRRRVLKTLVDFGLLDSEELARQQAEFDEKPAKQKKRQLLQLQLKPSAREGQPGDINKIPIYAHVKQTLDPILGKRDGIEINYMKFLAYNGPYKLFRSLWVGPLGAHDADWEHVTVRLTPDGKNVSGVYYSAHRHRDGVWRSADAVPLSEDGRPLAYVAENGHGSYPVAGTILRLFFVINDYTSANGKPRDPSLESTYVEMQNAAWLKYEGKWGSTVEAPQRQEWFVRAENPVSRTWLQQVFFPLLPGVETIWEPALEELEEAVENLAQGVDDGLDRFKDAAEDVQREFEKSREAAYKRWRDMVKAMKRRDS